MKQRGKTKKIFVEPIDKYNNMCYNVIVRGKNNEKLFIQRSNKNITVGWMV